MILKVIVTDERQHGIPTTVPMPGALPATAVATHAGRLAT